LSKKLVAVEIPEKLAKSLAAEADTEDEIRALVTKLLEARAGGGVIVSAQAVKRIAEVTGSVPSTPEEFIAIAERSVRQRGDKMVFEWEVDPVYVATMRSTAERMDLTMEKLMQVMIDQIVQRGLLFTLLPEETLKIPVTPDQMKILEELAGVPNVTATNLIATLENAMAPAFLKG
jgi:hypothetical protein